jgi:hypothetical protein
MSASDAADEISHEIALVRPEDVAEKDPARRVNTP